MCTLSLCSCFNSDNKITTYTDDSQLNGKDFDCMSGSVFDQTIAKNYPDSKTVYYNSRAELLLGLKSGKVECYLADEPVAMIFKHDNPDITYIRPSSKDTFLYGFCFSKESLDIKDQFDLFFEDIEKEGLPANYREKWMCEDAMSKTVETVELLFQ